MEGVHSVQISVWLSVAQHCTRQSFMEKGFVFNRYSIMPLHESFVLMCH